MITLSFVCLFLTLVFQSAYGQREKKFFRKDYHYIDCVQNFYKIQTIPSTWQDAKQICEWEGATLFYPEDEAEAASVLAYMNLAQGYDFFWIGISSLLAKGVFETIDGRPIEDVYHKWSRGEPNNANGDEDCVVLKKEATLNDESCGKKLGYICKKTLKSLEWNSPCNLPYMEYKYNEKLGKCYKFHRSPLTWKEAYTVCSAELSILAVSKSQAEADFLNQLTELSTNNNTPGFHNSNGNGWRTTKDTNQENSGYCVWGSKQPDGSHLDKCGTMFYNGQLKNTACNQRCSFICEHDDIGIAGFDDKFSDRSADSLSHHFVTPV